MAILKIRTVNWKQKYMQKKKQWEEERAVYRLLIDMLCEILE